MIRATGVKEFSASVGMPSPNVQRAINPKSNPTQDRPAFGAILEVHGMQRLIQSAPAAIRAVPDISMADETPVRTRSTRTIDCPTPRVFALQPHSMRRIGHAVCVDIGSSVVRLRGA